MWTSVKTVNYAVCVRGQSHTHTHTQSKAKLVFLAVYMHAPVKAKIIYLTHSTPPLSPPPTIFLVI